MGKLGRLVLATALFIAQMSVAAVACACPPLQVAPPPKATSVCPMSKKADCPCCLVGNKDHAGKTFGAQSKCQVSQCSSPTMPQAAFFVAPQPAAILSQAVAVQSAQKLIELPTPQHLVVYRVRPPDPGLHGLRAPPAS